MLDRLPPSLRGRARQDLHAIHDAGSRVAAGKASGRFVAGHGAKHGKAADRPSRDREALPAFHDSPAGRRKQARTANPIAGTFAAIGSRTARTKGCPSRKTALAMVLGPVESAGRRRRHPNGSDRLARAIDGVRFRDGEPVQATGEQAA